MAEQPYAAGRVGSPTPGREDGPSFATREDGARIAYHRTPGRAPGVVFLTGYQSDMTGQKALRLEEFCRQRGNACLRFDYFGHGASSGDFTHGTIGRWADDAVFALDRLTEGPQILIGSSLGGWIMMLAARARPQRVAALIGIAAAPDFTEDVIPKLLRSEDERALASEGIVYLASPYDPDPTPVTRRILEEGRAHLVLREPIPLTCPIRLIHALDDPDVPWTASLRLMERMSTQDAQLTLIKKAGHRMSEPADLDRLTATLEAMLRGLERAALAPGPMAEETADD
jgi:pimeloyl-ACP methyl ester carboxylesterase